MRAAAAASRYAESVAHLCLAHAYRGAHHADSSTNDCPCHVKPDADRADRDTGTSQDQLVTDDSGRDHGEFIFTRHNPAGEALITRHAGAGSHAEIQSRRGEDTHAHRDHFVVVADCDENP